MGTTVVVVDDEPIIGESLVRMLKGSDYDAVFVKSGEEALELLRRQDADVVLTDINMPGLNGIELVKTLRVRGIDIPTVVMSGGAGLDTALQAVHAGAFDFIEKPVRRERLLVTMEACVRYQRLSDAHTRLQGEVLDRGPELLGTSSAMQRLRELVERAAQSDARVLITGENGTGKELVAQLLHAKSMRHAGPFVTLNCAAVPKELVESELFGHEKGAFTGAAIARKGRFQLADGGTLFLDEVGDMPAHMQAKLLRVLQEGTFERVGGERTRRVDVRVVAATNRDIEALVNDGEFREDLYYRLNVLRIHTPPLRERSGDVQVLARMFAEQIIKRGGRKDFSLADDALQQLSLHSYPGNVRELHNLVERLSILAPSERATAQDVRELLAPEASRQGPGAALYQPGESLAVLLRDSERRIIEEAIRFHDGSKGAAAKALGVDRSNFYKKCNQLGVGSG